MIRGRTLDRFQRRRLGRRGRRPTSGSGAPGRGFLAAACLVLGLGSHAASGAATSAAAAAIRPADAAAAAPPSSDPAAAALAAGNRLARNGDLEEALRAYAAGYSGRHPLDAALAYNLGTTAHHLGRLPLALLWYRRAAAAGDDDPWLQDNLALARRSLRAAEPSPAQPPPPPAWTRARRILPLAAVLLSWAALPALALPADPERRRARLLAGLAVLVAISLGAGGLAAALAPRAAVLLAACPGTAGEIPPGAEVWVTPASSGAWHLSQAPNAPACPRAAVGLIEP
jgi:tetratricopeptide (TPR) repeat protein